MSICIGEVVAVEGTRVTVRVFDQSNKDTLYFDGKRYKGVSIREYIKIERGFREIVCLVEGEYLDERRYVEDDSRIYFERKIHVKPIGHFNANVFEEGVKWLPMIKDRAYLVKDDDVIAIYSRDNSKGLVIGSLLKEEIRISLPWTKLFNSHIGIFGNTGSGKSNTLAKLYTALFESIKDGITGKSKFVLIDFNGEYTSNQFLPPALKQVVRLKTSGPGGDKIGLSEEEFWNNETLSILFQATTNTQRPFLARLVNGRKKYIAQQDSLTRYAKAMFAAVFCATSPKPETLDMLREVCALLSTDALGEKLKTVTWHSKANKFFLGTDYFNSDGVEYENLLKGDVDAIDCNGISCFAEVLLRANLQLIRDVLSNFVQFEHIQPLIKRAESKLSDLEKVLELGGPPQLDTPLTVVSLRDCNQEIKKVLPLLVAKHYYSAHRATVKSPPERTLHFIIDEAHNILSEQSSREHEVWRDYRLEVFEEMIKEGRKFGVFVTLASQRPADISPTVVSQLHNYFIHRLVNERDLYLIDNAISTLDAMSKSLIPNLSRGCCVVTGTAFDVPMIMQVDLLDKIKQPNSEDVDLAALWGD